MSSSAYGRVIYGYCFDSEILRVPDGVKSECSRDSTHEIFLGKSFCPTCGDRVNKVPNMVHSPLLISYANKNGISRDDAYAYLIHYQHEQPRRYPDYELKWVFGILVAKGDANSCKPFHHVTLGDVRMIFEDLGFKLQDACYHLLVELS